MRRTALIQALWVGMISVSCLGQEKSGGKTTGSGKGWLDMKTIKLKGLSVTLSQPVLVARSKERLWFPTLINLEKGKLLAVMSNVPDAIVPPKSSAAWSSDGGLTWRCDKPLDGLYSDLSALRLKNGDRLLLPFYLFTVRGTNGVTGTCPIVRQGQSAIEMVEKGVSVTGWPRACGSLGELGQGRTLAGFVFNGQNVELKGGGYLATLYGYFEGPKHYSLLAAESANGRDWRIRSVIADETSKHQYVGAEGPCESALCRLKDGRLMCVFRNCGPYWQCWSQDEGKTWTDPVYTHNAGCRAAESGGDEGWHGGAVRRASRHLRMDQRGRHRQGLAGGRCDGASQRVLSQGADWQSLAKRGHDELHRNRRPR